MTGTTSTTTNTTTTTATTNVSPIPFSLRGLGHPTASPPPLGQTRWGVARSSNGIGETDALCRLTGQSRGCKSTRLSDPHRLISQGHGERCGEPNIVPSKPDSGPKRRGSGQENGPHEGRGSGQENGPHGEWRTIASKSSRPPKQPPGATNNPGKQQTWTIPGQQPIPCSVGE